MAYIDDVLKMIRQNPGLSALELSQLLYGQGTPRSAVYPACLALVRAGKVKRSGGGKHGDPYRYESK